MTDHERLRRWRLALGGDAAGNAGLALSTEDAAVDALGVAEPMTALA